LATTEDGGMPALLTAHELRLRAASVRLVLTDVDGVLTDGGVYYSERGEALKRFSLRDGMGVERLRDAGIETAFITRESSPIVVRRAEKLQLRHLYVGVRDKRAALDQVLAETQLGPQQLAYIGDDVNDQAAMAEVATRGLTGAPADAEPPIRRAAHFRTTRPGGYGAFREFAEWILRLREEARAPYPQEAQSLSQSDPEPQGGA
jgi:3-deoxy-D-manno-octulosonate 8-phosphate phosphatase (KDO 8-P phosphatase)